MQNPVAEIWLLGALCMLGLLVALIIYRRGYLSANAFDLAPKREAGLIPEDMLIVFLLILAGSFLTQFVMYLAGVIVPIPKDGAKVVVVSPLSLVVATGVTFQIVGQVPVVAYILIEARRRRGWEGWRNLGIASRNIRRDIFIALAGFIAVVWLTGGVAAVIQLVSSLFHIDTPAIGHDALSALAQDTNVVHIARLIISVTVLAPVLEEIIYRGLIQTTLIEMLGQSRRWTVITIAAVFFALVHYPAVAWQALPVLFVLAMIIGWVYERTGSLWPCIIIHSLFNLMNVLIVLNVGKPA